MIGKVRGSGYEIGSGSGNENESGAKSGKKAKERAGEVCRGGQNRIRARRFGYGI